MLSEIIKDVANNKESLVAPMLKTKILASRLDNVDLLNWIDTELNGYDEDANLPPYRVIKATTSCTLSDLLGNPREVGVPVPISLITDDSAFRDFFLKFEIREGVESIEGYTVDDDNDMIGKVLPTDMAAFMTQKVREGGNRLRISDVKILALKSNVRQTLSSIRSKLLDLTLKLERLHPELSIENIPTDEERKEINRDIQIIMSQINITGNDNNVNAGDNNNLFRAEGENNRQAVHIDNTSALKDLNELVELITATIDKWGLSTDDLNEVKTEINRLNNQLVRANPKRNIVIQSLEAVKTIGLSIAANAWTEPVLGSVDHVIKVVSQNL